MSRTLQLDLGYEIGLTFKLHNFILVQKVHKLGCVTYEQVMLVGHSLHCSSLNLNWRVAHRLDNFVVGLTNNNPATTSPVYKSSYTLCGQFSGSVAVATNATVVCSPSSQTFRYVIVQGSYARAEALCLAEVYVYARSE